MAGWSISGVRNLSGALKFLPGPQGPWLCGKFQMVELRIRAWLCRTNAPGPFFAVRDGQAHRRGGPMWPPAGTPGPVWDRPIRKDRGDSRIS